LAFAELPSVALPHDGMLPLENLHFVPGSSFFDVRASRRTKNEEQRTKNKDRSTKNLPRHLLRRDAAEMFGGQIERPFVEAELAAGDVEDRSDLLGEDSFSSAANTPLRIVEFAAAQIANAIQHF